MKSVLSNSTVALNDLFWDFTYMNFFSAKALKDSDPEQLFYLCWDLTVKESLTPMRACV
jgi:hypothetical protein